MDRNAFLSRVTSALYGVSPAEDLSVRSPQDWGRRGPKAAVDDSVPDLVDRFVIEAEAVGTRVIRVSTIDEASNALRSLITGSAITWDCTEFDGWRIDWLWDDLHAKTALDLTADIGVTTVDYAVANTGTLIVTAAPSRPRSVSLVVSTHIALVDADQIVQSLGEAFDGIQSRGAMPSAIHCITGPSRSADIENDLTIGVHGPAALVVVLLTPQTGVR